ncbi:hypothetical protein ACMGE5_07120 [Macrococcus equi]|uniref:hypothetical protein n=1 Tax=Macrococcus equi TaxID=3395462 RepID=UPI0039BDBAC5
MTTSATREVRYVQREDIIDLTNGEINPENYEIRKTYATYTPSKYENLTYKERNPNGITFFHLMIENEADIQKKFNLNMIELGRLMMLFTYASYRDSSNRMYLRNDNGKPITYKGLDEILKINKRSLRDTIKKFMKNEILFYDEDKKQYYFTDQIIHRGEMNKSTKRKKAKPPYRFYNEPIREIYNALNDIQNNKSKLLGLLMCITPYIKLIDNIAIQLERQSSNNVLVISEYDKINERYEAISQKMLAERLHITEKSLITYFKELNEVAKQTTGKHLIYKYKESLQAYGQRYKYTKEAIVINPRYTYSSDEQSSKYRNLVNAIEKAEGNILELKENNKENEESN